MYMKYISYYKTKDRFEIYTLLSAGCVLGGYESDDKGVFYFRFEDKEKCKQILAKILSKKLKVYMHDVVNAIRDAQTIFNRR